MVVIGHGVLVELGQTALLGADGASKVAEVIHGQRNISGQSFAYGLAVLPSFRDRNLFQVFLDAVRNAVQEQRTLGRGGFTEGFEGLFRGIDSQVDIGFFAASYLAKYLAVYRTDVVHIFTIDGRHPLAADVVVIAFAVVNDGAFGSGGCIQGHGACPFLEKITG